MITQTELKELLEYKDGGLYWKVKPAARVTIGDRFGAYNKRDRYRTGAVYNKPYREHRLIYLYHYGCIPDILDHINGVRDDNRIENLRASSHSDNGKNRGSNRNNTSGHQGVSWHRPLSKWRVQLNVNGKNKHFGYFEDFDLACLLSDEIKSLYYGDLVRKHYEKDN